MKSIHPRLCFSTLVLIAGTFLVPGAAFAESTGQPIGGIIGKGGKNPGASFNANPAPNGNGMAAVMEALQVDDLAGNPGKPPVVIDVKKPIFTARDFNSGLSSGKGINEAGIK